MFLLRMFTANPITMLYVALAIAAVSAATVGYGAWEVNGWRLGTKVEHVERERDMALAQLKVLASATQSCTDSVTLAKETSDGALKLGGQLLQQAQQLHADIPKQVATLEQKLKQPTPLRADGRQQGCDEAWVEIERKQQ